MSATIPNPHYRKLQALLENSKLPESDGERVREAIQQYENWISILDNAIGTPEECLKTMVDAFNSYKLYVDLNFIFDSPNDFLYRQKGQLKLDNTIIEEFLPRLVVPKVIPELEGLNLSTGPTTCFSSMSFNSSIDSHLDGGGMQIKSKDQDFSLSKKLLIKASHNTDFSDSVTLETSLGYLAAECKTNLDKTMFQEASATAKDLKSAVMGVKYYLLVEWLDMTPIATSTTFIDEVLVLRKAKRISSNIRSRFSSASGRQEKRDFYSKYLQENPFQLSVFKRFCQHVSEIFPEDEETVLVNGYF